MKQKILQPYSTIVIAIALILIIVSTIFSANKHLENSSNGLISREILINGGKLLRPNSETGKTEEINIKSFYIDKDLTTVGEFDEFVKKTAYVSEADKFGNSAVLIAGNWELVDGANYLYPSGKDKAKAGPNYPVTQVSWNDAVAYAKWRGKRLPSEVEWEFAATNRGRSKKVFPWGNDLRLNDKYQANVWQGTFPTENAKLDGYEFTSPVGVFPANELGINDMGGNVWQWCADVVKPSPEEAQQDPALRRPTKGASYLTDVLNDQGARIFGRASSTPETGICHTGFRLVKDVQ
jgi:sulfatase modifying factor 1